MLGDNPLMLITETELTGTLPAPGAGVPDNAGRGFDRWLGISLQNSRLANSGVVPENHGIIGPSIGPGAHGSRAIQPTANVQAGSP